MDMIERIARAIDDEAPVQVHSIKLAKAALAAIRETHAIVPREPTPDMKMKGAGAITSDHMKKRANYDAAIDCYRAMIEAGEAII